MKKLENLNQSKLDQFKDAQISQLNMIIGGWRQTMSSTNSGGGGHDVSSLTDIFGHSYDGSPGDGTAGDWSNTIWYPGAWAPSTWGVIGQGQSEGSGSFNPSGLTGAQQNPSTGSIGATTW